MIGAARSCLPSPGTANLAFLVCFALSPAAAEVVVSELDYGGRAAYRVSNGEFELVVVTAVGPRVMRFGAVGGPNLFKELPAAEEAKLTAGQDWRLYGGHRLWVAPEEPSYTYAPDNEPAAVKLTPGGLIATAPVDAAGIEKEIEVALDSTGGGVHVTHRLTNRGPWPLEFAPWAMSMMAPGGTALAMFPPRGSHPEDLLPSNPLVLWPYTNLSDPRWGLFEKYLTLRNDPAQSDPEKIGLFNPVTAAAYLLGEDLFVKVYRADPRATYADQGCSLEMFTNELFLEIETLGPLEQVAPGETVEHIEQWSLYRGVKLDDWSAVEIDRAVLPLLRK